MFEGVGSIRGRVTVKCHARRVEILFLVGHYRRWKRRRDNRFKVILNEREKLSRNWTRNLGSMKFHRFFFLQRTNRLAFVLIVGFFPFFPSYSRANKLIMFVLVRK